MKSRALALLLTGSCASSLSHVRPERDPSNAGAGESPLPERSTVLRSDAGSDRVEGQTLSTGREGLPAHVAPSSKEDERVEERVRELTSQPLSLDSAFEVALLRNRSLQATYESIGVAQADLVQAGLLRNPTLSGSVRLPLSPGGLIELEGSLVEDFLSLFTLPLRKRFASLALEDAKFRVGSAVLELSADVQVAFVRLQAAQQLVVLRQKLMDAEGASSELAARQYRAGNIPELDAVNRQAAYEEARLEVARAENDVLDARETLTRLMGVWGQQAGWQVTAPLPPVPEKDVELEHLEPSALSRRLDLAAARTETESLTRALELASGTRFLTQLEVGVSGSRDTEGNRVLGPTISLELPLFDQHQAQLARLEAQVRQARAHQEGLAIEVRSEVRRAYSRLHSTRAIVEHYRTVLLPLRERTVRLSQERYNAMLLGVYGLLQAKQLEISAYREYLFGVRDYWIARSELERASGGKLPSPSRNAPAKPSSATSGAP